MVSAFAFTEINYLLVSLLCDLARPLSRSYLRCLVPWLRYLPCFWHSDKSGYGFPKVFHHILVGANYINYFHTKCSL